MQSSADLWMEFKEQFLTKLTSAEFQASYDSSLTKDQSTHTPASISQSLNNKTPSNPNKPQTAKLGKTFQRRRSKTGDELRGQIAQGVLPTPQQASSNGASFFMTEDPNAPDDHTAQVFPPSPRAATSSNPIPMPPPSGAPNLPSGRAKKSVLRQSIETTLRQAGAEKNKPIPHQFSQLRALLERLSGSREEQQAFFKTVEVRNSFMLFPSSLASLLLTIN
jgi:hypothetical protein